jgi:DNA-binding CsgD family transcriptional regulator
MVPPFRAGRRSQRFHDEPDRSNATAFPLHEFLTKRENEILAELLQGASNKDIARRFAISLGAVAQHRAQIIRKFGARNTADLVRIVMSELWSKVLADVKRERLLETQEV